MKQECGRKKIYGMREESEVILKIRNLQISFTQYERGLKQRTFQTVRGMNLEVRKGELTAIVGASGSGKSLLAHAVLGILPYNASMDGEIFYCGELLSEKRKEKLKKRRNCTGSAEYGLSGSIDESWKTGL